MVEFEKNVSFSSKSLRQYLNSNAMILVILLLFLLLAILCTVTFGLIIGLANTGETASLSLPIKVGVCIILLIGFGARYELAQTGCFQSDESRKLAAKPLTVENLMQQIRGDELNWNQFGLATTKWEMACHSDYQETCQRFAIRELGKLKPAAVETVPELIELFKKQDDLNWNDGLSTCYRSEIARVLGSFGQPEAISPLVEMLRKKSLSRDLEPYGPTIRWHDEDTRYQFCRRGAGPEAIVAGLMLFDAKYHNEIVAELKQVRAEIESSKLANDWSKFEIDRALRFFAADSKTQAKVVEFLQTPNCWYQMESLNKDRLLGFAPEKLTAEQVH